MVLRERKPKHKTIVKAERDRASEKKIKILIKLQEDTSREKVDKIE